MITVRIEPDGEIRTFPALGTVLQLQHRLNLRVNDALIIRGDQLLTPDLALRDGDELLVRKVVSRG